MVGLAKDKKFIVYCHTNIFNNKKYIGVTSQKPNERWRKGKGYKPNSAIRLAFEKYGWDNFTHEILDVDLTKEEAEKKEIYYIGYYDTMAPKGYNLTAGGMINILTPESRKKCSEKRMGVPLTEQHKKNISKGKDKYKKSVWMCDKKTHERLMWFESLGTAAKYVINTYNVNKYAKSDISRNCRGKTNSAYGFYWEWGDDLSQA